MKGSTLCACEEGASLHQLRVIISLLFVCLFVVLFVKTSPFISKEASQLDTKTSNVRLKRIFPIVHYCEGISPGLDSSFTWDTFLPNIISFHQVGSRLLNTNLLHNDTQ